MDISVTTIKVIMIFQMNKSFGLYSFFISLAKAASQAYNDSCSKTSTNYEYLKLNVDDPQYFATQERIVSLRTCRNLPTF